MEKKNLIIREKVENDARLKKLTLTSLAKEYAKNVLDDLNKFEEILQKDISEEELDTFNKVLLKLENNIDKELIK